MKQISYFSLKRYLLTFIISCKTHKAFTISPQCKAKQSYTFKLVYIEIKQTLIECSKIDFIQMYQKEGGQSCVSEVKLQEPIYASTEKQQKLKYEPHHQADKDQIFSRESEANWNINNGDYDNQSLRSFRSSSTNKSKRPPNQDDLCNAILTLRKKLPQRSLEQVIIRLHQSINHKKQMDSISNGSKRSRNYEPSVCSRKDDFDDSKSYAGTFSFNFDQLNQQDVSNGYNDRGESNFLKYDESNNLKRNDSHFVKMKHNQDQMEKQDGLYRNRQDQLQEAGLDYIYKPSGQEIMVQYLEQRSKKVNFINIQEQTRYLERRVMAKSFIERGYGVSQCRKQIQAQNLSIEMHRNTYKTLAGSVIILAFRKLESFIANQCGKTIKYLDRWQMRSICTTMLNCRTNMEPEQMDTLFKYIKAAYGLGDVRIGEIQSIKLYLAIQKHIQGKNVTMEALQKIGEIQQKKNIDLTHEYLKRKKLKRQQRLQKLRKLRIQVKQQKKQEKDYRKNQTFEFLEGIDLNPPELKLQSEMDGDSQQKQSNYYKNSMGSQSGREHSVSHASISQANHLQSVEQQNWLQQFDKQYVKKYLESKDMIKVINSMQESHDQLANWNIQLFEKRFCKIIKKSVKKVQMESQMSEDPSLPILNRLDKDQMKRLMYAPYAQNIRNQLLAYFLLEQPNLEMLIQVTAVTNIFFYGVPQGQIPQKKRGRGRPPLQRYQAHRTHNYSLQNYDRGYQYNEKRRESFNEEEINFSEEFEIQQEQLRKTFGEPSESQPNQEYPELDIDTNDLRFEQYDQNPSQIEENHKQDPKMGPQSIVKIQYDTKTEQSYK